jgi:hypothetical protein
MTSLSDYAFWVQMLPQSPRSVSCRPARSPSGCSPRGTILLLGTCLWLVRLLLILATPLASPFEPRRPRPTTSRSWRWPSYHGALTLVVAAVGRLHRTRSVARRQFEDGSGLDRLGRAARDAFAVFG